MEVSRPPRTLLPAAKLAPAQVVAAKEAQLCPDRDKSLPLGQVWLIIFPNGKNQGVSDA
jgi:hypothetical protein